MRQPSTRLIAMFRKLWRCLLSQLPLPLPHAPTEGLSDDDVTLTRAMNYIRKTINWASWFLVRCSRYGLRGVKVGEASHPGLQTTSHSIIVSRNLFTRASVNLFVFYVVNLSSDAVDDFHI